MHHAGRAALSVLLAGALFMPAFPLSEVMPAYADTASSDAAQAVDGASSSQDQSGVSSPAGRLGMDVSLDGTVVVAQDQVQSPAAVQPVATRKTEEEKQAILDGYLADGTITEADLDNEFIVSSLTESYLEQYSDGGGLASGAVEADADAEAACGNCLDEDGGLSAELEQRQAQDDEAVQAALEAVAQGPSYEDVLAAEAARAAEEEAAIPHDESLSPSEVVTKQPYAVTDEGASGTMPDVISAMVSLCAMDEEPVAYGAAIQAAQAPAGKAVAQADDATGEAAALSGEAPAGEVADGRISASAAVPRGAYSPAVVMKNVQSVALYTRTGSVRNKDFFLSNVKSNAREYTVRVKAYNMPEFCSPVVDVRWGGGKGYLTLRLPASIDEEERHFEVFYTSGVDWDSYVKTVGGQPAVNDATVKADLANTPGYVAAREYAYLNAYKLAPFASYEDIVKSGNAMPANSPLTTKEIRETWPVHKDDGMKVSLFEGQEQDIVRSVVYFADGTSQTLDLDYLGKGTCTASYATHDTGVLYQPNFWTIGESAQPAITRMASYIRSKTWATWFQSYGGNPKMHRSVRDYFDKNIRDKAEEVAANLVTNIPAWNACDSASYAWNYVMQNAEAAMPSEDWTSTAPEAKMFNLLFLYTYLERFFGFNVGGDETVKAQKNANGFLVMAFRGSIIRSGLSLLSMTPMVRKSAMPIFAKVDALSEMVIAKTFYSYTGLTSSTQFVQLLIKRTTGYASMAEWFKDYMSSIAFYHEYMPPEYENVPESERPLWRGWDQASRYPDYLLLWLTLEPGTQYFASTTLLIASGTTGNYEVGTPLDDAHRASYKKRLDNIFIPASRYMSTVTSIVGVERVDSVCVVSFDNIFSKYDSGRSIMEREGTTGKKLTEDPYLKNFTDVSGRFIANGQGAAAMTNNISRTDKNIYFLAYTALGCAWDYYWSHEMAHAIDKEIFLNGEQRGITNNEDYTDGFLTQGFGGWTYVMNLTFDWDLSKDVSSNLSRERIMSKEKIDDYYHKMYETLDMLDYAALQAFLRLDKDEQNAVASQAWFDGQNGTSAMDTGATATILHSRNKVLSGYDGTTATMPVNASVFNDGSRKFETVEEVYDNQLFLRPGLPEASSWTWLWANYVADDLRGVWWFPIHCNGNRPDSRSFKLEIYRMLGDKGFDAWAEFGRNGGGGDLAKLQKLTGYGSFKEWQMAKWDAIEANEDKITYVDFDDLVDKFEAALKTDAGKADRNLTQMNSLRSRMYFLAKRMTNDFRSGVYEDKVPVTHIRTAEDLQAIADNPYGSYVLDNDIKVSGIDEAANGLVDIVFMGKLDGQGHRIYTEGELLPALFAGAKHAYIKNLSLEGTAMQLPAKTVNNTEVENVSYTKFERNIYSVDDFVGIGDDLKIGVDTFHLMADLDFTEWSAANAATTKAASVVVQLMSGTATNPKVFNGNGHTITGLTGASLFANVHNADINNLTIRNCSNLQDVTRGEQLGILACRSLNSKFSDLFFDKVNLRGKWRIGFVSGDDGWMGVNGVTAQGSQFRRIQVTNGALTCGQSGYGGFITGWMLNGSMEDIYVQGALAASGPKCGGMLGSLAGSGQLNRCISKVDLNSVAQNAAPNVGVLLGDIEADNKGNYDAENTRVSNCVGLGKPGPTQTSPQEFPANAAWRLAGYTAEGAASAFRNCYEDTAYLHGRTLTKDEAADVSYARSTLYIGAFEGGSRLSNGYAFPNLRNEATYKAWGFSDDTWEFDPTINAGYPVLRFEGDKQTFYDYDLDCKLDFKSEKLLCWGSDFERTKVGIHNLPYLSWKDGTWHDEKYSSIPPDRFSSITEDPDSIDLSEIIEYKNFPNDETAFKGTRSVSLFYDARLSGKPYSFEKTVEMPPRLEMDCADRVRGVRAGTDGMGAIHFASIGVYKPSDLEYRPVAAEGADSGTEAAASDAGASEAAWIPMTAAVTPVVPGTYEVRIAATDHSFASYSKQVVVDERDPDSLKHPLVLDANGGSWVQADKVPVEYNSEETLVLPTGSDIKRDGYTFVGWYESDDFAGSPVTQIEPGQIEPITLYARWSPNIYAVTLNLGGGAFANAADNVTSYVTGTGATLAVPSRAGYTFGGWFDNEACAGSQVNSIGVFDFGDKELWAKWSPLTYTVALELMGGELAEGLSDSLTYQTGTGIVLPTADDISRVGYTFAGWFDNAGYAGSPVTAIAEGDFGDKQLWAKWTTILYEVSLEKNQGTLKVGEHDVFSYQFGVGASLPELERAGYEFGGWYANADCSGDPVEAIGPNETGERKFWAKWTPITYTVVYNMGSDHKGDVPPGDIDLSAYESYTTGTGLTLPAANIMAWEGHDFGGWYDNATFEGSPIAEIDADGYGDLTLYARWASDACVLFFHENGGTFVTTPQTVYEFGDDGVPEGSTVTLPREADITRDACVFEGWYDNADFSGQPLESVRLVRGNIDLYAKWTFVKYGVTYELNGGAWAAGYTAPDSYTAVAGAVSLPDSTDVVRDGFVFDGWFADAAFAGASMTEIAQGTTGDLTLYAKWREPEPAPDPDPNPNPNPDPGTDPDPDPGTDPDPKPDPDPGPGTDPDPKPDPDPDPGTDPNPDPGPGTDSKPDPDPDPDPDPEPAAPRLEIVSLAIGDAGNQVIEWDENRYAKIEMLASKVPTRAEDFVIEVPEGIAYEVTKRTERSLRWMAAFAEPFQEETGASTIWDITLRSLADPSVTKNYVLEIVPLAEGYDPTPTPTPSPAPTPTPTPTPSPTPTPVFVGATPAAPAVGGQLEVTGDDAPGTLVALGAAGLLALVAALVAWRRRDRA